MAIDLTMAFNIELFMDRNFDRQFKGIDSTLSRTAERVRSLGETSRNMRAFSDLAAKCQTLTTSTSQTQTKLQALQSQTSELNTRMQANAGDTERLSSRYQVLKSEAERLNASGQKNTATYQRVTQRMRQVKNELKASREEGKRLTVIQRDLTSESSKLERSLSSDTKALAKMKAELQNAGVDTNNLVAEQARLSDSAQKAEQSQLRLAAAQAKLQDIRSKLSWQNVKGDILSAAKYFAYFQQPIAISKTFNQAMANVKAVTGASTEDFMRLRSQSQELGASTQFSATQAANTQENLARAGFSPEDIINTMPSVLAMAAADGMDLAQAGNILAGSVRGYGLNTDQSARIADMLAFISANSRTNVAMAGEAFSAASGTGQLMAIEPERMGAYIGALANRGIQGMEAATAIERSIQALAAPTETATNMLKKFDVRIKTKEGNLRFMDDVAVQLLDRTAKLGAAGQVEAFKNVFGKAYGPVMQKLALEVKSGGFGDMYTGLKERKQGAAQGMADVRNDTLQGDITALGSAWEGLMERIGTAIEPINRYVVQTLSQGITRINEFIREHEGLVSVITKIVYVGAGLKVFYTGYKYMKLLLSMFTAWRELHGLISAVEGSTKLMTTAQWLYNAALNANPIGLFITGLAGVAALSVIVYKNWEKIAGAWQGLIEWWNNSELKDIWQSVKDSFNSMISMIPQKFNEMCEWIAQRAAKLNPFNWELPTWLGGGTPEQRKSSAVKQATTATRALDMAFGAPSYEAHATGGILTRPHLGLVAEAGPEAVVPLRDKSRGIEVLTQAAGILGVNVMPIPTTDSLPKGIQGASSISGISTVGGQVMNNLITTSEQSLSVMSGQDIRREDINAEYSFGDIGRLNAGDNHYSYSGQPTVNITVNSSRSDNEDSLAEKIARAVSEALSEFQERQDRLSFA